MITADDIWNAGPWLDRESDRFWVDIVVSASAAVDACDMKAVEDQKADGASVVQARAEQEDLMRKGLSLLGFAPADRARFGLR